MTTVAPEILWAQRSSEDEAEKNVVMLTINVPNLPAPPATKFDLTSTGFSFHAKVGDAAKGIQDKGYAFKLDFFEEIDVENSKQTLTSKCLYVVLRKKETKLDYWPRLTKDKVRLHNVKTDFDKWVDEDEQTGEVEDLGQMGMGGMDPSMMGMGGAGGAAGGMGGLGGMDLQQMMAQMGGGMGGMPDFGAEDDDDEDEDDDTAAEAQPAAAKDVESID